MTLVFGLDGCRAGWVAVAHDLRRHTLVVRVVPSVHEFLTLAELPAIIAIDVPIGLPHEGPRPCDIAARAVLGRRASSVFPAPSRQLLSAESYSEANELSKALLGKGISKQAWSIVPKIREVDGAIRSSPALRTRLREVHPEVCFTVLNNGRPMDASKKKRDGKLQRQELLRGVLGAQMDDLISGRERGKYEVDDLLDACVAVWTAGRIYAGQFLSLPAEPGKDECGLPMAIAA
jgi:predicted RNase H-like nuclease